jgi:predicted ATP-dependent serine protease
MGKEKKGIGIKTTRYFTKNCSKCSYEYPNWFTNCPKCGVAWDDAELKPTMLKEAQKKNY